MGTARCASLLWCFDSNLENHLNIEVWNSFLILSCVFLTTVDAHADSSLEEVLDMLKKMKQIIENSDALLYTPRADIDKCTSTSMYCYLLELDVILREESGSAYDNEINMVYNLKKKYYSCSQSHCPACETHPVANATVFTKRMEEFIQKLSSRNSHKDCD
ncbi:interleukin-15 isoform X2 [Colossoma macropomum]|uniref:interleukin-15 isoform X2 n=1 Tax=Colossoma macropomum TaxID=42526 RepID=UPI001863DE5F|nr:interleukin-15 isoform X2 [Colossoma macropomum]